MDIISDRGRSENNVRNSEILDFLEEEDEEDHNRELRPRFFRTPENSLVPAPLTRTASDIERQRSDHAMQKLQRASVGMLPSTYAHLHRRTSANRSPFQPSVTNLRSQRTVDDLSVAISTAGSSYLDTESGIFVPAKPQSLQLDGRISDTTEPRYSTPPPTLPDPEPDGGEEEVFRFGGPLTCHDIKEEARGCCSLRTVKRKLPILNWLPKYGKADALGDLIAGLTVALTVIPQCLAYAVIADIKLEYGLNSAYLGCFVYTIFGTSKDVTVGPTAILSLLTGTFISRTVGEPGEWAVLLCFFVGCVQLLMGMLRLGFIINFISTPVVSGFTQAAVVVIILSQVKNMMGLKFGASTDNIIDTLRGYAENIPKVNGMDVLMGCVCMALLLAMGEMRVRPWKKGPPVVPGWYKISKETVRLLSVSRYAVIVLISTAVNFVLESNRIFVFSSTGKVDAGLSPPKPPNFSVGGLSFAEVLATFGSGLVLVPLLALMESVAVAKTFAHKFRYNISVTQEFIALGAANLVSSFFGAYPVTGAFTRSALNAESGVRTPLGGVITGFNPMAVVGPVPFARVRVSFAGTTVIIAIVSLGGVLRYIPKASLGAVIICACLKMLDFQIFRELYYIHKSELFVLVLTLLSCLLLRVDYGLIIGLTVSILMLVYPMARPIIIVTRRKPKPGPDARSDLDQYHIKVMPNGPIFFPAAEFLKDIFSDALFAESVKAHSRSRTSDSNTDHGQPSSESSGTGVRENLPPIIFDGIHLTSSDYSSLRALRSVLVACKTAHRDLKFVDTSDDILNIIVPHENKRHSRGGEQQRAVDGRK